MRTPIIGVLLLLSACGGGSEADAKKDRAASMATWALLFPLDGAEVRLPLKEMNVLLFKDEEVASKNPVVFEIQGDGVSLFGQIPPANNPGYDEKWEKLIGATLTVKPSGEFHHDAVESRLALPGKPEVKVLSGTLTPESTSGKWSGSEGNKTLKGKFSLLLSDGRRIEGTFAVHAITWG
ncbi:MAG: hypothetical protein JO332_18985 [Planctomycetaceae bacterium]|nr:hypothetical protein [Planctomycetaceae bacterium]